MINKVHTSCRNCVFAEYEDKTQVGCRLDMLEKYDEVLEAYDEEKEFFVINNMFCRRKRSEQWAKRFPASEWANQVERELEIKWHPILFFTTPQELIRSIDSIKQQSIPPAHVTVINGFNSVVPSHKITKWLKGFNSWRVQSIESSDVVKEDQIDLVIDTYKIPIYMVFDAGYQLEPTLIQQLNNLINEEMLSFALITKKDNTLKIIPTAIHEKFGGSSFGVALEEKIKQQCPQKILEYENLIK